MAWRTSGRNWQIFTTSCCVARRPCWAASLRRASHRSTWSCPWADQAGDHVSPVHHRRRPRLRDMGCRHKTSWDRGKHAADAIPAQPQSKGRERSIPQLRGSHCLLPLDEEADRQVPHPALATSHGCAAARAREEAVDPDGPNRPWGPSRPADGGRGCPAVCPRLGEPAGVCFVRRGAPGA